LSSQPVSAKVIKKLSKFKAHNKSGSKRSGGDNTKSLVSFAGKKAAAKGKQFNVLVVDDSQYETECITQMCAESNFTTSVAHGEADATAILDSQQIDLVLLDFHMPKFNTMAYLNQLKQRGVAVVGALILAYSSTTCIANISCAQSCPATTTRDSSVAVSITVTQQISS
jgi:CheY-like chemotaxis protein